MHRHQYVCSNAASTYSWIELSGAEGDGVNPVGAWVEEPPVLLHAGLLKVLVEHGEHVRLHLPRPPRRALAHVLHQVLVVRHRVLHRRRHAARRRPPGLRHHDPNVGSPELLHRRVQRVHCRVEQILVPVLPVLDHGPRRREEREAHVHGPEVEGVDEVRVQVGQERGASPLQEGHHIAHERLRLLGELAGRRRDVDADSGLRYRRRDLDVVQAGRGERGVDVLHGGHEELRLADGDFVAHDEEPERDARVGLDVLADPLGRGGLAGGQGGYHVVGRADDDPDAAAAEGAERGGVRPVEAHDGEAVVAEHVHHGARRWQVVAARAVAHTNGCRPCIEPH
uniref:Uncharacterized protein n=1 Tax=Arundo donax TaxID=35708 RepID=A0A0A9CMQ0_ARUDO